MFIINLLKNRIIKNKKGQEAFELAIIFPLMAMLILVSFDLSQVIKASWEAKQLARAGVRTAIMVGSVRWNKIENLQPQDKDSAVKAITTAYNEQHRTELANGNPTITLSTRKFKNTNGIFFQSLDAHGVSGNRNDGTIPINNEKDGQGGAHYNTISCEVCLDVKLNLPKYIGYDLWGSKADGNIYTVCETYRGAHSNYYQVNNSNNKNNNRQ